MPTLNTDKTNVTIMIGDDKIETGLKKMGAMLGNYVEVGCNSVLCPGTVIFPNTNIYPLTRVRGVIGANKIVKDSNTIVEKEDR